MSTKSKEKLLEAMKKLILAALVSFFLPVPLSAQVGYPPPGGSGGGVTDHGVLTGLADDDHTQYLLKAGGTMTGPLLNANGCTNPGVTFAGAPDMGICSETVTIMAGYSGGAKYFTLDHDDVAVKFWIGGNEFGRVDGTGAWFRDVHFRDLTDPTKIVQVVTSSVTTSTTRTFTFPDANTRAWGLPTSSDGSVVVTDNTSTFDIGDAGIYPLFSSGTANPTANCTAGREYFGRTDTGSTWACQTTNTWTQLAEGSGTASGTNTGDVTLAGTPDYITIAGQAITRGTIDVADLSVGTDGQLITWDASGNPATVATGTSGQVLTSNGAGAAPTFQAAAGGAFDPSTKVEWFCEFLGGDSTSGRIGECNMQASALATGTTSQVVGLTNPGAQRLNSHATNDNSGYGIRSSGALLPNSYLVGGEWTITAKVLLGSNSTAITSSVLVFGLVNAVDFPGGTLAQAIYIRRDTDLSDTAFVFAMCDVNVAGCASAGDDTHQDSVLSSVTPSAGSEYLLKIRRVDSGVGGNPTYYFSVNGEAEKTFCSAGCDEDLGNQPTTAMFITVLYGTRTTTGVLSADVDYVHFTGSRE